jgi:uncharacterized protein (DUF58 family)
LVRSCSRASDRSLCYHGRITRRGKYRFGPLKISTSFPLGLVRRTLTVDSFESLTVCPRLGQLTPAWSSIHQQTLRGAQRILRQQNLLEPDFYGLREWKQGDSSRSIHWRTSARRGELLVRQSAEQREQHLLLLVDLWQPRLPTADHLWAVERAVSFAATVVAQVCRHGGSELDLGLGGTSVRWSEGPASAARLSEIMEELAVVEASSTDRLAELVARARRKIRSGTTTLLVSTRPVSSADLERFESVTQVSGADPKLGRVLCIDTADAALDKYFHLEAEK